jgi:DnaJ-class molecular chaperone
MIDPYQTLGVSVDAPDYVIKAAYHACLKKFHPDIYREIDASARTMKILGAYEILGHPERRASYDISRAEQNARANKESAAEAGRKVRPDRNFSDLMLDAKEVAEKLGAAMKEKAAAESEKVAIKMIDRSEKILDRFALSALSVIGVFAIAAVIYSQIGNLG